MNEKKETFLDQMNENKTSRVGWTMMKIGFAILLISIGATGFLLCLGFLALVFGII